MLTKTLLKAQLESFPEHFSLDDLVERLILLEKVELGSKQSKEGDIISEQQMEKEINQWFN